MLAVGVTLTSFGVFVYHCLMQIAPDIVLPIFAVSGVIMGLNAFVYVYYSVRWVLVRIVQGFRWLFGRGSSAASSPAISVPTVEVKIPHTNRDAGAARTDEK